MDFTELLKDRNPILYWFGLLNLIVALFFIILSVTKPVVFGGTNAWFKPVKFALSTAILSWSVALYSGYLTNGRDIMISNWIIAITLGFEVLYIGWQAGKGQASHYNVSTPFYSGMYYLMAIAATIATIAVGYIGLKFFMDPSIELPDYYLWAIRLGFILFFIFSFEGFIMGGKMAHSVGGADGGKGIPFLNWSVSYGDLRIAHFIGMHALQVLPILAWYIFRNLALTIVVSIVYGLLALMILAQSLNGKAIIRRQANVSQSR